MAISNKEAISAALQDLNSGRINSIRAATKLYGVSRRTLARRRDGIQSKRNAQQHRQILS